jgi:hypothetical protein
MCDCFQSQIVKMLNQSLNLQSIKSQMPVKWKGPVI